MPQSRDILCLFDVDGTLTLPRKVVSSEISKFLMTEVKPYCSVALVGGSDLPKMAEQMGGEQYLKNFDFVFAENGLCAYKNGNQIGRQSIQSHIGEQHLQKLINYTLLCLSQIELPVKRGTFIEFRTGMLNISPIGRSCTRAERNEFEIYDNQYHVREQLIEKLKNKFPDLALTYSIGGQISFDVFPTGWDKTFCLNYLENEKFKEIHFFGDRIEKGGNDYELYNDPRVYGHHTTSPEDTRTQVIQLLKHR